MRITSFLIHCEALSNRLPSALDALSKCQLRPQIVKAFDGSDLLNSIRFENTEAIWHDHLRTLKHTLIGNTLTAKGLEPTPQKGEEKAKSLFRNSPDFEQNIHWMHYRELKKGEISVLLKHYYAISAIASQGEAYGLVAEDDIIGHEKTSSLFNELMQYLSTDCLDYVDLAGGCGLLECEVGSTFPRVENLYLLDRPRTRTNACYIISKKLANKIANQFLPFSMPIDWHLQYLFNNLPFKANAAWCVKPVLIHGSESGAVRSWRETSV